MANKDKLVTAEQIKYIYDDLSNRSSALVLDELPETGDANTDYYVPDEGGKYTHYRWIDGEFQAVGSADNSVEMYYRPETLGENDESIKVKSLTINGNLMTITDEEGNSSDISISGGGGGGGSVSLKYPDGASRDVQCVSGGECVLSYIFEATDSAGDNAGNGTATWYVKGIKKAENVIVRNGASITNTFDIGAYLNAGETNDVLLSVAIDIDGTKRTVTKRWSVNAINLYATWDYDETTVNDGDTFILRWTPYGNIEKTTHLLIDGVEVYKDDEKQSEGIDVASTNGTARTFTMDSLSHGSHIVSLYVTATVNEQAIQSQTITHSMIFDSGSNVPIVSCSLGTVSMTQYDTLPVVFTVYAHDQLSPDVTLAVDGTTVDAMSVGRELVTWNYTPSDYGAKVLTITCGATVKTINVTVARLEIDNEEISGYDFKLKASELAGNTALRAWSSNGVSATFSSNFDWTNGGIQTELDDSNNPRQYICVKAGTRMTIGFNPLAKDPKIDGVNFKMIFKAVNCRDYDAKVASCANNNGVGISLEAHKAAFISTATTVEIPYGEDEYIELEFEAYPKNTAAARYMMAWVDGVIAMASVYTENDGFNPNTNLVIGSDDCDVYVYLVKSYPTVLTRNEHIENFIADAPNAQEMLRRYNRNNILNQSGEIDYEALADQAPDCRIWLYDIPRMTQSKEDKVYPCGFKQIWHEDDPDYQYYQLEGTGTMSIQGTSSVMYKDGAANTDINFADSELADGTTVYGELYDGNGNDLMDENLEVQGFKINDDSTPITYSNTKVNFASCEQVNNYCNAEWYQAFQPYPSLTPRDCMEFGMGVQFIKDQSHTLWNDDNYHMYSIANMGNSKKNTHVFHSSSEVCIEVNNNEAALCLMTTTTGLNDVDWKDGSDKTFEFRYPKYKKMSAERLSAVVNGWNRFVTWMATNNPNAATGETLAEPVTFAPYTFRGHHRTGAQVLKDTTVSQFAGTYTTDSFNYRMAKMLSECEDYLAMDSVVYHFCFMERHTLVDNVAKNTFWSSDDLIHWDLSKAYDMDTADGNDNTGALKFDYGMEADDTFGGVPVFNGNNAVWFVFISHLYEACRTMYRNREAATGVVAGKSVTNAWNAQAYHQYLTDEQAKIPERVWNECYWYDYLRTYEQDIDKTWIAKLAGGKKTHQRWHYEYFEEKYDASKYMGELAVNDFIRIRAASPSDAEEQGVTDIDYEIPLTMYNKCYVLVGMNSNSTFYNVKAQKDEVVTIDIERDFGVQIDGLTECIIAIDTASMIQTIGDVSLLYPKEYALSRAYRVRSATVGSSDEGYNNPMPLVLNFENNTMLEELNVQNLTGVNAPLDLSNCVSLETLDARGSSFTGYTFAQGGKLAEAYINAPTTLSMRDLQHLTDANFHVTSYANLTRLRIENCPNVDSLAIINAADNLETLRAIGIDWTLADTVILDAISEMTGINESGFDTTQAVLTGTIHYTGVITSAKIDEYETLWPDLIFDTTNATLLHQVNYIGLNNTGSYANASGNYANVIATALVADGANPPNITTASWTDSNGISQNLVTIGDVTDNTHGRIYHFSGWTLDANSSENNPNIFTQTVVNGTLNIFALYTYENMTYTVRWHNEAGSVIEQDLQVAHGATPEYNGSVLTKDADVQYTYTFAGWATSENAALGDIVGISEYSVTGDTDFYPVFSTTVNQYTITWISDDGETVLDTETYDYGASPVYKQALPTKTATAQYTYTFAGWANTSGQETTDADALAVVTGDRSIYAAFGKTVNTYTVTWQAEDGTVLETDYNVPYGTVPTYDGEAVDTSIYAWAPNIRAITGNTVYTLVPVTTGEITDSWEDIISYIDDGTYSARYKVGAYKPLDLGTEGIVDMQIVGIDVDTKTSGGTAPITWISKQLLTTSRSMNSGNTNSGGFAASVMRSYLINTIKPKIPEVVRSKIVEVTKYSYYYGGNANTSTSETVWIPSCREVGFTGYETSGPTYTGVFTSNNNRIKYKTGSSTAVYWWLRSAGSGDSNIFRRVSTDGSGNNYGASYSYGVALGFCM